MPVTCKLQNGKYRIVGPDGKIEKNDAGTAVDGGGHDTMDACRKQAAAINSNLAMAFNNGARAVLVYEGRAPVSTTAKLQAGDEDPKQVFKKDMIKVGVYEHPIWGWTMDVTEDRLHRWAAAFKAMRENGVDVEVPLNHSHDAADNLGYVIDMFVEPDDYGIPTLFGLHEIRGQDAIDIVARNKNVSVYIDSDYRDGMGRDYGEVIVHSSIVQQPVVPAQADFVPVAASLNSNNVAVNKIPVLFASKVDLRSNTMTDEMLAKLRELLGAGEDLTADNALSRIAERLTTLGDKNNELEQANIKLQGQIDQLKADTKANSLADDINPNLAEQMASAGEKELNNLVNEGKILPAVRDKLKAAFVGEKGSRNIRALCLRGERADQPSTLDMVCSALAENDPVKLGEATKRQSKELARMVPGKDDSEAPKADTESGSAMLSGAGVTATDKKD